MSVIIRYMYRAEGVKKLLATTAHSISEIATLSGFSDAAYFSRAFRKAAGVSASEYRRKSN